jgi:hypothetical protein
MWIVFLLLISIVIISFLIFDYVGPRIISLRPVEVFGFKGMKANDLIVQEYDALGNLWATRGMIIYRLVKGDDKFIRVAHVPIAFTVFWLLNFSIIRRWSQKFECMEITVSADGDICAFAAGFMFAGDIKSNKFIRTMKLPQFGIGIGRGMISTGLLNVNDKYLFWGEYFRNERRTAVKIYKSKDFGKKWCEAYTFPDGIIRHIHTLQRDPFTGKLWICTGDFDDESMIGWSDDEFMNIQFIGNGAQRWRSCQLVFTENAVYWGADTGSEEHGGIYRWDKTTMKLEKLIKVDGAIFFGTRLEKGTMVMSTDREGFPNEKDDMARLYVISNNHLIREVECGEWCYKQPGIRFGFAKTRFQRNQGGGSLVLNFLNQKGIDGGSLIMISEQELINIL